MIDDRVKHRAERLEHRFAAAFSPYPVLALDRTWPSNGTISLLLDELGRSGARPAAGSLLVDEIASYVGLIAYGCWSAFPNIVRVELALDAGGAVILSGEKPESKGLKRDFRVSVSALIRSLLSSEPQDVPQFDHAGVSLHQEQSMLPVALLGLCTGLCPIGEGSWKRARLYQATGELLAAQRVLGISCSEFYHRTFPHEPLGADANLYSSYLILPPQGFDEPAPSCRAVTGLFHFFSEREIPPHARNALLGNLITFPDEHISNAAWAFSAALCESDPPQMLRVSASAKRTYAPSLRLAVMTARRLLGKPHDWVTLLRDGQPEQAACLARIESSLHLLPLMLFSDELFARDESFPLLEALAWSDLESALGAARRTPPGQDVAPEIRLQHLYLESFAPQPHEARAQLDNLRSDWAGSGPALSEISGRLHLLDGKSHEACSDLERALLSPSLAPDRHELLSVLLVDAAVHHGDFESASRAIDSALAARPLSLPCRLKKLELLRYAGDEETLAHELLRVGQQSPTHPDWFRFIVEKKILDSNPPQ